MHRANGGGVIESRSERERENHQRRYLFGAPRGSDVSKSPRGSGKSDPGGRDECSDPVGKDETGIFADDVADRAATVS